MLRFHLVAFVGGFLLDLVLGDPYWLPHPIRWIGRMIGAFEKHWKTLEGKTARRRGTAMVVLCLLVVGCVSFFLLFFSYRISSYLGMAVELIMTYQILATKCLKKESMKVYRYLQAEDLPGTRTAVSMIVGRDTEVLDETGLTKATIETVAENASDGVIAPMIYTAIGGPVLGFLYKTVNTMDSMVGYKNDRYLFFGRSAAKLDDVINFLPSRISALFMILAAFLGGKEFDGKRAWRIHRRDRFLHASPNSAQTESACAGALGIQLAGDASYFGKIVKKPYIGDDLRPVEAQDICRVNKLLYISAFLCMLVLSVGILAVITLISSRC